MKSIFIDSDVFLRDIRYPRDARTRENSAFLAMIRRRKKWGVTSIFNVLEVCGILSFNLSQEMLLKMYADFSNHFAVKILFPADATGNLHYDLSRIFEQISLKQSLGDAQISYTVSRFASHLKYFVSWNAPHFAGKIPVPVITPDQIKTGSPRHR